mmetsp:Transcript_7789/g.12272  ORF Transcript_7789/g.12272 Transcript_7789/m.12272 type:complete len:245 (-) Transcript_7789:18-752(-)
MCGRAANDGRGWLQMRPRPRGASVQYHRQVRRGDELRLPAPDLAEDRLAPRRGALLDIALLRPHPPGLVPALRRHGVPARGGRKGPPTPMVQAQPIHTHVTGVAHACPRPHVLASGHGVASPAGEDYRTGGWTGGSGEVEGPGFYPHRRGQDDRDVLPVVRTERARALGRTARCRHHPPHRERSGQAVRHLGYAHKVLHTLPGSAAQHRNPQVGCSGRGGGQGGVGSVPLCIRRLCCRGRGGKP